MRETPAVLWERATEVSHDVPRSPVPGGLIEPRRGLTGPFGDKPLMSHACCMEYP
jgi:hypothetical protein